MPTARAGASVACRSVRAAVKLSALFVALILGCAAVADAAGVELRTALRHDGPGVPAQAVTLPDELLAGPARPGPLHVVYRLQANLGEPPAALGLYLPGLVAHARIRVNGHPVFDTLGDPSRPLPRSAGRLQLLRLPDEFLRIGPNEIEIEAAGARYLSLSPVWLGELEELQRRHDERLLGAVIGPAIVATVMGCLALCVLLLWLRRPSQSLHGYFGAGALLWALHSAWTVLPVPLLGGVHLPVWWTSLYAAFVVFLVVFCVRLAGWRWPWFERALWLLVLAAPAALYAGAAVERLPEVAEAWRLACIAAVGVGVVAVSVYAWRRRDTASVLLVASGAVSLAFGLRDWEVAHRGVDNNPVFLTPYAALSFIALVAWMLIDGFVHAADALERANAALEERVARKSEALRDALEEMRAARDLAQAADRAKSSFLAAASHDLRQPVHAIGLYLASIPRATLAPATRETLSRIGASLGALGAMFDALLDISRMDAGIVVPREEAFDLDALMRRLGDEFAPLAEGKGLRLLLHGDRRAAESGARADPFLVERIVRNLLSNAVKYTHEGGVLLAWRLRAAPSPHWRVEVRDTGVGIEPALQPRVFEEFFQVASTRACGPDGLGLGLSIVRRLARLMHLSLAMDSVPGHGTRFRLALPVTAAAPAGVPERGDPEFVGGAWIGLLDDDQAVLGAMRQLAEHWGCRVVEGTGVEALLIDWHRQGRPAVNAIVADLQLHEGDGLEAVHALREAFERRDTPALIVTGDASPARIERLNRSGLPWLAKPVPPARLRSWLAHVACRPAGAAA